MQKTKRAVRSSASEKVDQRRFVALSLDPLVDEAITTYKGELGGTETSVKELALRKYGRQRVYTVDKVLRDKLLSTFGGKVAIYYYYDEKGPIYPYHPKQEKHRRAQAALKKTCVSA
jgi:hypothetical protein